MSGGGQVPRADDWAALSPPQGPARAAIPLARASCAALGALLASRACQPAPCLSAPRRPAFPP
eukprot:8992837-Pyramimonas_sp.AAC.1